MTSKHLLGGLALLALSSPALADHMGPSGVGSGGGLTVFGPDTLDEGHGALGFRLTFTKPKQRSDAKLASLANEGIDAHNTDHNLVGAVGAAYGITHELTVSAELPYVRRDHLREGVGADEDGMETGGVERLGNISGIGDLTLLAKYRLSDGEGAGVALIGGIKTPTGSTHRRSRDGERLETEHQPGTGSWDPIAGFSTALPAGALRLTVSALYQFSGKGAQHTRLGDRLQGGIAVSHHFGPAEHEHEHAEPPVVGAAEHHHGDELREKAEHPRSSWDAFVELGGEWEGRQTVAGETERDSGGKWLFLAPGARFTAASGWSAGAALAIPVWQRIRPSHPNNVYRLMLSLGRAF